MQSFYEPGNMEPQNDPILEYGKRENLKLGAWKILKFELGNLQDPLESPHKVGAQVPSLHVHAAPVIIWWCTYTQSQVRIQAVTGRLSAAHIIFVFDSVLI